MRFQLLNKLINRESVLCRPCKTKISHDYPIRYALICHPGRIRRVNQDNYICAGKFRLPECHSTPLEEGVVRAGEASVFGVFDGLGGEKMGELAALIAAETASEMLQGADHTESLAAFCKAASDRIDSLADSLGIDRMGTTAALLSFGREMISLCNVGDSRIYRYCSDTLKQLSVDHSFSPAHGVKGPLTQALGCGAAGIEPEPYLSHGRPARGEVYLICSDGLTDMLTDEEIRSVLREQTAGDAAAELYASAMEHGGKDNITILICRIEETGE